MAKLQDVKVMSMVNGEVTEVSYNGADYKKVDGVIEDGDLLSFNLTAHYTTGNIGIFEGKYYGPVADGYFKNETTECSVRSMIARKAGSPNIFRKVDEIIEGKPQVGDKIRIVDADSPFGTYKNGDIFTVETVERGNEVYVKEHGTFIHRREFVIIERKEAAIEGDAQVGDKIRIVNAELAFGNYENGDIRTVKRLDSDKDVYVEEHGGVIVRDEFVIIERPERKPTLQVGDYAKVVEHNNDNCFGGKEGTPVGDIVKVIDVRVGLFGGYRVEELDGGNYGGNPNAKKDALVKATDAEVAAAKRKAEEKAEELEFAKFSEGDKVRLISGGGEHPLIGYKNGEVYTVKTPKHHHGETHGYMVRIVRSSSSVGGGYAKPSQLVKVSEKELADIAEQAKFAEIGRKPGEFKKGDIVRAESAFGEGVKTGEVEDIASILLGIRELDGKDYYGVKRKGTELITPVEHRFDK